MKRWYPWLICIVAMFMLTVTNGMTMTGITAFDESLLTSFGWTRAELKLRDMFNLVLAAALSPFVGALIDKVGVRKLLLFSSVLLALLYLAYSRIESIYHVYLIHVGFAAVVVSGGLSVAVIMVSQWFDARRGTALGVALVGSSLGGMFIPKLIVNLVPAYGWRESFMLMTALPLALFVLSLLVVKTPAQMGMKPLQAAAGSKEQEKRQSQSALWPDLTYGQALRTRTFWALAVVAMTTFYSIMALSTHLMLHMADLGFDPKAASNGMFVLFGMGMIGKFLFGFLADMVSPKKVFVCNLALMMAGSALLATQLPGLLWSSLLLVGLGWGGLYALLQLQIVGAFGLTAAGKILGTISLMDAGTAGLGIWLSAVMFDHFGNYTVAFAVIATAVTIGFVASFFVREERRLAFEASPQVGAGAASLQAGGQ
jgi:MFS family permease